MLLCSGNSRLKVIFSPGTRKPQTDSRQLLDVLRTLKRIFISSDR